METNMAADRRRMTGYGDFKFDERLVHPASLQKHVLKDYSRTKNPVSSASKTPMALRDRKMQARNHSSSNESDSGGNYAARNSMMQTAFDEQLKSKARSTAGYEGTFGAKRSHAIGRIEDLHAKVGRLNQSYALIN